MSLSEGVDWARAEGVQSDSATQCFTLSTTLSSSYNANNHADGTTWKVVLFAGASHS